MSVWQEFFQIFATRNRHLDRIATALERIAPEPEPPVDLKPEEAVTYVDEQADALREMREDGDRLQKYLRDHPEEEAALEEGFGEGDVRP